MSPRNLTVINATKQNPTILCVVWVGSAQIQEQPLAIISELMPFRKIKISKETLPAAEV